jgi:ABC-type amino acid transport system permease subunit
MTHLLLTLTLTVTAAVVAVLVAYLLGIIVALARARASLKRLANSLVATRDNTRALPGHVGTVNDALPELLDGLRQVNGHLQAIVGVAGKARGNRRGAGGAA